MDIRLYNSYTDKIETLKPVIPGHISMYVCGPTVYDFVHIGNLRPVVVFDVLRRLLEHVGYQVTHVSNYTDIDDKIIAKAIESHQSETTIADKYIKAFEENVKTINSYLPTVTPRVTNFINQIIDYIAALIEKGAAYVNDGEVFFNIARVADYGHLSNMKLDDLISGARIDENSKKRSPLDFLLWKKTDQGITFSSPWGQGRPGWHTECAVMIDSIFPGKIIDIHGGGFDLKFPHHDNEIAQSIAQNGTRLANIWMHNGFINLNDDKMSKSTGNLLRATDALEEMGGPALRLMLLATHYRLPVNLTTTFFENARTEIQKISGTLKQLAVTLQIANIDLETPTSLKLDAFLAALSDDLNTSNALTTMNDLLREINRELRQKPFNYSKLTDSFFTLNKMLHILGLDITYPRLDHEDRALYDRYLALKQAGEYEQSDRIRAELMQRHIL